MLEAFPSDRADDALDISPLPRGSRLELGSNPELFLIPQRLTVVQKPAFSDRKKPVRGQSLRLRVQVPR